MSSATLPAMITLNGQWSFTLTVRPQPARSFSRFQCLTEHWLFNKIDMLHKILYESKLCYAVAWAGPRCQNMSIYVAKNIQETLKL